MVYICPNNRAGKNSRLRDSRLTDPPNKLADRLAPARAGSPARLRRSGGDGDRDRKEFYSEPF